MGGGCKGGLHEVASKQGQACSHIRRQRGASGRNYKECEDELSNVEQRYAYASELIWLIWPEPKC